jgi:hypothetical protein
MFLQIGATYVTPTKRRVKCVGLDHREMTLIYIDKFEDNKSDVVCFFPPQAKKLLQREVA